MQNNQTISKREIKETIASLKQTGVVVKCTEDGAFSAYKNNQKEPYFSMRMWLMFRVGRGFDISYNGKKYIVGTRNKTYTIAYKLFGVCASLADGDTKRANRKMFPYVVQSKCRMFFNKIAHQR